MVAVSSSLPRATSDESGENAAALMSRLCTMVWVARAVGREVDVDDAVAVAAERGDEASRGRIPHARGFVVAAGDDAAAVARPGGAAQAAGVPLQHVAHGAGRFGGGGEEEAARAVV